MPAPVGESGQAALPPTQRASSRGQKCGQPTSSFPSAFSSFAFPKEETKTPPAPRRSASSPRCAAGTHPADSREMALPDRVSSDNRKGRDTTSSTDNCCAAAGGALPTSSNMITNRFADRAGSLQMCCTESGGSSSSPSLYSTIIKEKRSRVTFTNFYKTKLCPWYLKGNCHWGATCNYAHTLSEQREAVDLTKTKLCSTWLRHGACHNQKCRFAHDYSELRATTDVFKTALCSFYIRKIPCPMEASCRFAHGVHELRPRGGSLPDTQRNGAFSAMEENTRNFASQQQQLHKNNQQRLQQPDEHQHVNREARLQHQQQAVQQQQQQQHQQRHLSGVMAAEARLAAAAAAAAGAAARAAAAAKAATEAKAAAAAAAAAAGVASTYDAFPYGTGNYKALQGLQPPPPGFSPISRALQGRRAGAAALLRALAYEKQQRIVGGKSMRDSTLEHTLGATSETGSLHPPHATGILTLDKTTGTWQPAVPSPAYRPPAPSAGSTAVKKDAVPMVDENIRQPSNKKTGPTPGYPLDSLESTFDALVQALHQQQQQQQQRHSKETGENWPNIPSTVSTGMTEDVGKAFTMLDFTKLLSTVAMAIAAAPVSSSERPQQQHQQVTAAATAAAVRGGIGSTDGRKQMDEFAAGHRYPTYRPVSAASDRNSSADLTQSSWAFSGATYGTVEGQPRAVAPQTGTASLKAVSFGRSIPQVDGPPVTAGLGLPVAGRSVGTTEGLLLSGKPTDGEQTTEVNRGENLDHEQAPWPPAATSCSFPVAAPALSFGTASSPAKCPLLSTEPPSAAERATTSQNTLPFLSQTAVPLEGRKSEDTHGSGSPLNAIEGGSLKPSSSTGSTFLLQDCESVACTSPTAISTTADRLDAAGTLLVGGASPAAGGAGAAAAAVDGYLSPAASDKSGHANRANAEETEKKGAEQRADEIGSRQSTALGGDSE